MNWSKYVEKKGKTADFVKKERETSIGVKESYVVCACKCWDSETGEAMPDNEKEYSLSELENEKKRWDDEMTRAKAYSDGLALAIEDFKKL